MKPTAKHTLGLILIVLSGLALIIAIGQVVPTKFVDFPCFDGQVHSGFANQDISPDTRIGYCISIWPLQAISGGGIYAVGTTTQDEITVRALKLRRDRLTLYVNNHPLDPDQVYKTVRLIPSLNPWLIFTHCFTIKNRRIQSIASFTSFDMLSDDVDESWIPSTSFDMLYVSGDVDEGWIPNPLGLVILGGGIWLFRRGKK